MPVAVETDLVFVCTTNSLLSLVFSDTLDGLSAPGYPTTFLCPACLKCTLDCESHTSLGKEFQPGCSARRLRQNTTVPSERTELKLTQRFSLPRRCRRSDNSRFSSKLHSRQVLPRARSTNLGCRPLSKPRRTRRLPSQPRSSSRHET